MSSGQDQFIIHDDGHADSHGEHHGHVIVSKGTLAAIFGALLFFTLLTVGLAEAEKLFAHTFEIVIPQWVNVLVAMSIASVKTMLVVLYFMQLKYDNPTNGMVFIFTILTVGFFLGFTIIDLGNRGSISAYKAQYIVPGGTGFGSDRQPLTRTAAAAASNPEHPMHKLWLYAQHKDDHAGHLRRGAGDGTLIFDDAPMNRSGAERSRPVRGLTLPGFAPPKADPHAGDGAHGAAPAAKPADPAKPAPAGH